MSRPMYETEKDLFFENKVKEYFESSRGAKFYKLPMKYGADFLVVSEKGVPISMMECKCRRNLLSTASSEYMISMHKIMTCLQYADAMDIPFFLVVGFSDRIMYGRVTIVEMSKVRMYGRVDRGDPDDIEPCVAVPMSKFRELPATSPDAFYVPIVVGNDNQK